MMKLLKYTLVFSWLIIGLSCSDENPVPVSESISFKVTAPTSANAGQTISLNIVRSGNYKFDTQTTIDFYLSTDQVYQASDIFIDTKTFTFTENIQTATLSIILKNNLTNGNYYLITRISSKAESGSSYGERIYFSNLQVNGTQGSISNSDFTISGISVTTHLQTGDTIPTLIREMSVNAKLAYSSNANYSFTINRYLSDDSKYDGAIDQSLDNYSSSFSLSPYSDILNINSSLPANATGTKYIIFKCSYYYNGQITRIPDIIKQVKIISFTELITVSGLTVTPSVAGLGEQITASVTIRKPNNLTTSVNTFFYLNSVTGPNYFPYDFSAITQTLNQNITTISDNETLPISFIAGSYRITATLGFSLSGTFSNIPVTISGPVFQVKKPNVNVTNAKLDSNFLNVKTRDQIDINSTITSDLSTVQSLRLNYYLSADKTISSNDYNFTTEYLSYTTGTNSYSRTLIIPSTVKTGKYFLLIQYTPPGATDYATFEVEDTLSISAPLAVLYRDTPLTNYNQVFLFVDDNYVTTLNTYNTYYSSDCSYFSNNSTNTNKSYYIYYGTPGTHNFKIRSSEDLNNGVTIKQGNFTAGPNCNLTDVD